MRIANIRQSYRQINFGAGNFSLYSDFDGTYMPFDHKDICIYDGYKNNNEIKTLFDYCYAPFQNFINKFGDKFNFVITTGRNRPEFNYFLSKLKEQGADLPKPDTLITCDGKDIFYRQGGIYPKETLDCKKRDELSKKLNWNPAQMVPRMQALISKTPTKDGKRINVITAPINKSSIDYGNISLQNILDNNADVRNNFASFNEGYDFNPYIVFSDNADVETIKKQLEEFLRHSQINAKVSYCEQDWDVQYGVPYQSLSVKPYATEGFWKDKKINKLIDTHKKVEEIYKNETNDLVIVAGDAGNDEDMLNIFNYVDILGSEIPTRDKYEEFLEDSKNRELLRQLPIISVVVGLKQDLEQIRQNQQLLDKYGISKTVFIDYNNGDILLDGVKQAINTYSKQNEQFKNALPTELLNELKPLNIPLSDRYNKLIEEIKALFRKLDKIKESLYA